MADKKISEFESFPGKQDSKTHYVVSSGDSGGSDTTNYKVSFTDLVSGISGELSGSLGGGGGGEGTPGPGGSFNFGPTNPSNNSDVINFNQGETVRMYIDENGGVNVSEKLVVANGKETVLGGNTTIKETLTVEDGKATTLGGPVTIKGDSIFQQSAIFNRDAEFNALTNDPTPTTGKLYRKGNDLYFDGKKLLTDSSGGGGGKWVEGSANGQPHIHYNEGNVGIGITSPTGAKLVISNGDGNGDTNMSFEDSGAIRYTMGIKDGSQAFQIAEGSVLSPSNPTNTSATRFIIDTNGNIGIGTTSPTRLLSIKGAGGVDSGTGASIRLDNSTTGRFGMINFDDDQKLNIWAGGITNVEAIVFSTKGGSGTEQMRISSDGKVGIGTDSPDYLLDLHTTTNPATLGLKGYGAFVDGSIASQIGFLGKDSGDNNRDLAWIKVREHDHALGSGSIEFTTRLSGDMATRMKITSDGKVGIGTATPSAPLDISSTTGGVIIPRMTTAQRNAITSPTRGEMVFDDTDNTFYGYDGTTWKALHS